MNAACGLYEEAAILAVKLLKTLIGMGLNTSDKFFVCFWERLHLVRHIGQVRDETHKLGGQLGGEMWRHGLSVLIQVMCRNV